MARLASRALVAAITLFGVTLATFAILVSLPGDPLVAFVPPDSLGRLDDETRARLEREHGLDRPLAMRYLRWVGGVVTGDLGRSLRSGRLVTDEIGARFVPTLELNLAATSLAVLVGIPFGWWCARHPGGRRDRIGGAAILGVYALPFFWMAILLQNLLAVRLGVVPLYGRTPSDGAVDLASRVHHLALPAFCLALHVLAFYARFSRGAALAAMDGGHALFARARGLRERTVFAREGIAPSLVPLATLFGLVMPALVSGSVLVETIFRWPGLGKLLVDAVLQRDVPVVLALALLSGAVTIAGSLVADALTWAIDPRRRVPAWGVSR